MRLPVQTAEWTYRASGASTRLVAVQLSVIGSYRPPVFITDPKRTPPQTIMLLPVQTDVWKDRGDGALIADSDPQVSSRGSYFLPTLRLESPQTIIRLPVQTAAGFVSPSGFS